jgi:hypothetical protein
MPKHSINYFSAGEEPARPAATSRIAASFVGPTLFSLGIGLNVRFNLDWPLIIGAALMPIGAFLAFRINTRCVWQRRLALAALIINLIGTAFVLWLLSTATINKAT